MQRISFARSYIARISFSLKNLHTSSTYFKCPPSGHQNLFAAVAISKRYPVKFTFAAANLLTYIGLVKKNESEEFRSIVEKGERALVDKNFKLAEQLFHAALNIAQTQMKNENEVTNIYDKLADVAFESGDYRSAKKLIKSVMERLFSVGVDQNDLRILNLSLKLAKTFERLKKYSDAELGYRYCIRGIQTHLTTNNPYLDNAQEFLLVLLVDYAYFHYERGLLNKALEYFDQALEVCVRTRGEDDKRTVLILNNLGSVNRKKGDSENALKYFQKAEKLGENFPDLKDVVYVHLNLGYLLLEKNMLLEARRHCKQALRKSRRAGDTEAVNESKECLVEVRKAVLGKIYSQLW